MTVVYEDLDLPDGGVPNAYVEIRLAGGGGRPIAGRRVSTGSLITGTTVLRNGAGIDSAGIWQLDLVPNTDILPEGTTWYIRRVIGCDEFISYISVPITGGPFEAFTIEDDPLGTISPSALSAHEARLDLHGGGIEIDYAEISSSVVVTGSALSAAAVPGLQITIPDLARPVYIYTKAAVELGGAATGGSDDVSLGVFPAGSLGAFAALDVVVNEEPSGMDNDGVGGPLYNIVRLPAHSPGDYVVGSQRSVTPFSSTVIASVIQKAIIYAVAR